MFDCPNMPKYDCIHSSRDKWVPILQSFINRNLCSILSKAILKSVYVTSVWIPFFIMPTQKLKNSTKLVFVLFLVKPCCRGEIQFDNCKVRNSETRLSKIFQSWQYSDSSVIFYHSSCSWLVYWDYIRWKEWLKIIVSW